MGYKEIDHPADLAFKVWGMNENELLESILSLLRDLLGIKKIGLQTKKCETFFYETIEDLVFEVVNESIYLFSKCQLFPKKLDLNVDEKKTVVYFSNVISKDEERSMGLKALTYHKLKLNRSKGSLWTYLIFDV